MPDAPDRSGVACALCGRHPAAGFAMIGDKRYCHGDDDPEPTCYMRAAGSFVGTRWIRGA